MSLVDELARLEEMRARGSLSEDEFQRAKARLIDTQAEAPSPAAAAINRLRRSRSDKWLGGVCAGLGQSAGGGRADALRGAGDEGALAAEVDEVGECCICRRTGVEGGHGRNLTEAVTSGPSRGRPAG